MLKKYEKKKMIRLLKWINENPGSWELICEPNGDKMNIDKMRVVANSLEKARLYEVILIMMNLNRKKVFVQDLNEEIGNKTLREMIKDDKWEKIFACIIKALQ